MKKSFLLLFLFLLSFAVHSYATVVIYDVNTECATPAWGTPNSFTTDGCTFATLDFMGEDLTIVSYTQSLGVDNDSVIVGPQRANGFAVLEGDIFSDFTTSNGYTATPYPAGELISGGSSFFGNVGLVQYEAYQEGDTWPSVNLLLWEMISADNYLGFGVIRNNQPHYGWIKWDYQSDFAPGIGLQVLQVGIETTPNQAIEAGSLASNFLNGPYTAQGSVFLDSDGDGIQNNGELAFNESHINIDNSIYAYLNLVQGNPYTYGLLEGSYNVTPHVDTTIWSITTAEAYAITLNATNPIAGGLDFGFSPIGQQEIISASINAQTARCGFVRTHTITLANQGNTLPVGSFSYTLDSLCSYVSGGATPDSIVGQVVYFSIDSLEYFESRDYTIYMQMPNFNSQGVPLAFDLEISDNQGNVLHTDTKHQTVTCAYDPNDKTEFNGYTDNGFILPGDELDYQIRFQNTGNDTAYNVLLIDQLSPLLDVASFEMTACSHPCQTMIDDQRNLHIIFDDIYLADSIVNEQASHGFFRYRIHANADIVPGDIIENTASIYFDFNPAIVTNTTVNEVFDCSTLAAFTVPEEVCFGAFFEASAESQFVEDYSWEVDMLVVTEDDFLVYQSLAEGPLEVTFRASNPFCNTEATQVVVTRPELIAEAGLEQSYCGVLTGQLQGESSPVEGMWSGPADITISDPNLSNTEVTAMSQGQYEMTWTVNDGVCFASDEMLIEFLEPEWVELVQLGANLNANTFSPGPYTWYLDGAVIEGATESQYTPLVNGTYQVEVIGFNGCVAESEELLFMSSGIGAFGLDQVTISPNPFQEILSIHLADWAGEPYTVELLDEMGRVVSTIAGQSAQIDIERAGLAAGNYTLRLQMKGRSPVLMKVLVTD